LVKTHPFPGSGRRTDWGDQIAGFGVQATDAAGKSDDWTAAKMW
jgi:hypothetical protein